MTVDAVEGDLKGTDVLETLNTNLLTGSFLLVEFNRLHDTLHDEPSEKDDQKRKDKVAKKLFNNTVHYFVYLLIILL